MKGVYYIHVCEYRCLVFGHNEPSSYSGGAQWLSGRVLDSRLRGRGFEAYRCHCVVVLEQDTFILA